MMTDRIAPTACSVDWREWMRALGRQRRRLREFLALSQSQLAELSGVSQGAVSRLETGRGQATPLLVVVKVDTALRQVLRRVDPAALGRRGDGSTRHRPIVPNACDTPFVDMPLTGDPAVEELIALHRTLPPRCRETFRAVVRATAHALQAADPPAADPTPHACPPPCNGGER
jgi:transcriptional regulator with XRE-family HTH domain